MDMITAETNRYSEQSIVKYIVTERNSKHCRLANWYDTNKDEMCTFFGLILWIGLDKKPSLQKYWSKNSLYSNTISKQMSRNRFELILSNIHFSNNEAVVNNNKLYKIQPLINVQSELSAGLCS